MLPQIVIKNHMHNNFGAFFQQAALPDIMERESALCEAWLGLTTPAEEAPAVSLEEMGEQGEVSAGVHSYEEFLL